MSDPSRTDGENPSDGGGHWASLASSLGADTTNAVDPEQPSHEQDTPAGQVTPKSRPAKSQTKKQPSPARNHWQALAGWLGISSPPADEAPAAGASDGDLETSEPTADPELDTDEYVTDLALESKAPTPAPAHPAPASSFGANIFETGSSDAAEVADGKDGAEAVPGFEAQEGDQPADPPAKEAWEALGFEFKSKPEPPTPREDLGDLAFDGATEDAFADSYWDADSTSDVVLDDEEETEVRFTPSSRSREPEPPRSEEQSDRPKRSRRGGRRRGGRGRGDGRSGEEGRSRQPRAERATEGRSGEGGRPSRGSGRRRDERPEGRGERAEPAEDDVESFADSVDEAKREPDGEKRGEGRRGRGERGRRGGRRRQRTTENDTLDDVERRLEESAELFDHEDEAEANDNRDEVDLESEADETKPREGGRPPHRRIPSWEEAVGVLVEANKAKRSKRDSNGPKRGGRRGGRGRRPSR